MLGKERNMEMALMEKFNFVPTVNVKTDGFTAEVIGMYEMPYQRVLGALNTPHGPAQMVAMLDIFKLALVDQKQVVDLELMSFNEMAELLGQWTFKSTMAEGDKEDKVNDGIDPEKIIAMLADPNTPLDDVMEELNLQLEGHDTESKSESRKRRSFFGFFKKNRD